jgi:hypothetical protein
VDVLAGFGVLAEDAILRTALTLAATLRKAAGVFAFRVIGAGDKGPEAPAAQGQAAIGAAFGGAAGGTSAGGASGFSPSRWMRVLRWMLTGWVNTGVSPAAGGAIVSPTHPSSRSCFRQISGVVPGSTFRKTGAATVSPERPATRAGVSLEWPEGALNASISGATGRGLMVVVPFCFKTPRAGLAACNRLVCSPPFDTGIPTIDEADSRAAVCESSATEICFR